MTTPFWAAVGVVDRDPNAAQPDKATLIATVLSGRPNLDGGFDVADVISYCPVEIQFEIADGLLVNKDIVRLPLIGGTWNEVFIQLASVSGTPIAKSVVQTRKVVSDWLQAATANRPHRRRRQR